ncbi:MAG: ATP-binding protein [Candidatus Obscuribacterales bacterium]|nr:ATP-binding protein [Candidatus Obscuribacterales bacterium]
MLVDFRFKNFRSFKEETAFSMVASSDKEHLTSNTVETSNSSVPRILKVSCTYGANASGKSNLIKAIQTMQGIVAKSAIVEPNLPLPSQPFRLCRGKADEPTEFEITFFCDDVRYQFGFKFTSKYITSEWLVAYKTSKPQTWYSRDYNPEKGDYEYKFGSHLLGAKTLWRDATRANSLFLSTAIQLNSEQLKPVFDWITENLVVFNNTDGPVFGNIGSTVEHIKQQGVDYVRQFLSVADIAIENIELKSVPVQSFQFDAATGQLSNSREDLMLPVFSHSTEEGSATFELSEESHGTQRLFALAGPLFEIMKNGRVLIVDELDKSLHPLLVRHLIDRFQIPSANKRQAQLIFTSHDTSLLSPELLRRDQIWFTEKDGLQSSSLVPLSDFAPRKHEAFERGYLSGRYGAVPILREWAR